MNPLFRTLSYVPFKRLRQVVSALLLMLFSVSPSFAQLGEDECIRPAIEAMQRAVQERFQTFKQAAEANGEDTTGVPEQLEWPPLASGRSPGAYPPDGFYDEDLFDPETGLLTNTDLMYFLIADLATNFVMWTNFSNYFDPAYIDRIDGLATFNAGVPVLGDPVFPAQVNPATYLLFMDIIRSKLNEMRYPILIANAVNESGSLSTEPLSRGRIVFNGEPDCDSAKQRLLDEWINDVPRVDPDKLLAQSQLIRYQENSDGTQSWYARYSTTYGRIAWDSGPFRALGGKAKVMFSQLDVNFTDPDVTRPSNVPLAGTAAPYQDYYVWHEYASIDMSHPDTYVSNVFSLDSPPVFYAGCPAQPGAANGSYYSYAINAIVICSPNYEEDFGQDVTVKCQPCAPCEDGDCPIGGNTEAELGSFRYTIPLGSGRDGSSGSMEIYSVDADFLMASPLGLGIHLEGDEVDVLRDTSYEGIPRQIVTPQGLADITVTSPFKSYDIKFYDTSNMGAIVGDFYEPIPGSEFKTISIDNPSLVPNTRLGTINLGVNPFLINSPGHGLPLNAVFIYRIDAASGALPEGLNIGRLKRDQLYFIAGLDADNIGLIFQDPNGNFFVDQIVDAIPGQTLEISSPFGFGTLDVTETTDSRSRTIQYSYSADATGSLSNMIVTEGSEVRSEFLSIGADATDPSLIVEDEWTEDGDGNLIVKTRRLSRVFPWNVTSSPIFSDRRTVISETLDPDGDALTTTFAYYDDFAVDGFENYSHLKEMVQPDGYWERYVYDAEGRAIRTYSPYLNSPPSFDASTCRLKEIEYNQNPLPDQDGDGLAEYFVQTVESILGNEVARSYRIVYSNVDANGVQRESFIRCLETGAAWNASTNLVSDTWSFTTGEFEGEIVKTRGEDGLISLRTYAWDEALAQKTVTIESGAPNVDASAVIAGERAVTVTNANGTILEQSTYDIESGILLSQQTTPLSELDDFGRPLKVFHLDGTVTETVYQDCCGAIIRTDKTGIVTTENRRLDGDTESIDIDGISQRFEEGFDADASDGIAGFTRTTYRSGRGSSDEQVISVQTIDPAGRLITQLDPRDGIDRITRTVEFVNGNGFWEQQVRFPNNAVRSSIQNLDQSTREDLFDGVSKTRYEYGVESDTHDGATFFAETVRVILMGESDSELEWSKTYTDPLGRVYKTEIPDAQGNVAGIYSYNIYDANGRLARTVNHDGVTTLFQYNAEGEREYTALDINKNGVIDFAGSDRVARSEREVLNDPSKGDIVRSTQSVWESEGVNAETVISVAEASVDGLSRWNTVYGRTTTSTVAYLGGGQVSSSTTAPDGTVSSATQRNGFTLIQSVAHPLEGALSGFSYTPDLFDRVAQTTNTLTGAVSSLVYYDSDLLQSQTTSESSVGAGDQQTTTFVYDVMNRLVTTILPNGELAQTRYDGEGNVTAQYGFNVTPVEYDYDRQNRLATMTTWQDFDDAAGVGVSGDATTQWLYDANGRLVQKLDHAGKGPSYTYSPGGLIRTRSWSRLGEDGANPILTTYVYGLGGEADSSIETGDLRGIYYGNDPSNTAPVVRSYDRQGRLASVADASGTRTLSYEEGRLDTESYAAGVDLLSGYAIDRSFDALDRYSGFELFDPSAASLYNVAYGYDGASRLETVARSGQTVTYAYDPSSATRMSMEFNNGSQSIMTVDRNFDLLDRLTSHVSTTASETVSYAYGYNDLNQRTRATLADGTYWEYQYDFRGQVTTGIKRRSDGASIPGYSFQYAFDAIGNRDTATRDGNETGYSANLLNQYESRQVPRTVDVLGSANALADVFVDDVPVDSREGDLFFHQLDFSGEGNAADGQLRSIEVKGVLSGGGFDGSDRVAVETREFYVEPATVAYSHDDDGNLLSDGKWLYEWNAENRLVAMETQPEAYSAGTLRQRLEFDYDGQGRRISKKVYQWDSGSSQYEISNSRLYLYDGWNLIAEFRQDLQSSLFSLHSSFVWGLDLSGSMQGAGGVGGLLMTEGSPGAINYPAYDGNGNVVNYISSADGIQSWSCEYGPYGEKLLSVDFSNQPFGFSTKYEDSETELLYYGFRYYDPSSGRWPSRDPIGEQGGLNLYGMVGNDPVNYIDVLGLSPCCPDGKPLDCTDLRQRLDLLNRLFNNASNALRNDLDFQFDSELTLFGIDRAIDTSAALVGASVANVFNSLRAAQGAAKASQSLSGQLLQNGQLARVSAPSLGVPTLTAKAVDFGIKSGPGLLTGVATRETLRRPARFGTNRLRDEIQGNIENADAFVQRLADQLSELRKTYRECCQ